MRIVNTRVIGSITRPKQWRIHLSKQNDAALKESLSNKKTRQFVSEMGVLVDFIFNLPEDAEKKRIWHKMLDDYRDAMEIL